MSEGLIFQEYTLDKEENFEVGSWSVEHVYSLTNQGQDNSLFYQEMYGLNHGRNEDYSFLNSNYLHTVHS